MWLKNPNPSQGYLRIKDKIKITPNHSIIYLETSNSGFILGITREKIVVIDYTDHLAPIEKTNKTPYAEKSNIVVLPRGTRTDQHHLEIRKSGNLKGIIKDKIENIKSFLKGELRQEKK